MCHGVSWFVSRCVTVCVTDPTLQPIRRAVTGPECRRFRVAAPQEEPPHASEGRRRWSVAACGARGDAVPWRLQGGGGGTCMASAPAARHAGPDGRRPGIRVRAGKRRSARSLHAGAEAKQDVAGPVRVRVGRRGITGRSDRDPLVLQRFLVTPWLLESRYPLPRAGPGRPDASSTAGAGSAGPADHRPSQPRRETAIDLKTVRLAPRARTVRAIEAERGRSLGGGWHDCGSDCPGPTAHVEETDPGGAIT